MSDDKNGNPLDSSRLRKVAELISSHLEDAGRSVDLESVLRCITPLYPRAIDTTTVLDRKDKIKTIKSVLKTLELLERKLKDIGLNPSPIADVAIYCDMLIKFNEASLGPEKLSTKGGKKWQARHAAAMVAHAFAFHGAKITFGTHPEWNDPSTAFGRAVADVLGELDIKADWRRPTKDAVKLAKELEREISLAQETGFYE